MLRANAVVGDKMALLYGNRTRNSRSLTLAHASGGLYGVLGVCRDASQQEIRSAYKKLVHHLHPDKHHSTQVDTTAAFLKCKLAYEILSDSQRRSEYDQQAEYQVLQHKGDPGSSAQQWSTHSDDKVRSWQDSSSNTRDPTVSAAAVAAAANSSGLSAHPLGPSVSRQQRQHRVGALAGAVGAPCGESAAPGAAMRAALLLQHDVALEQFSSMQEAVEFLAQIDQQHAVSGLSAEDYEVAPGQQSSCRTRQQQEQEEQQSQQQRWGAWHPGTFVPNPTKQPQA